jgi:hypothetical protein
MLFTRQHPTLIHDVSCDKPLVFAPQDKDFNYYDKDGFELNVAEQKYYHEMQFPISDPILNHCCWQEPWFKLKPEAEGLLLDHCMFLCKASYSGEALEQLKRYSKKISYADLLVKSKRKWGFDFALDAVAEDGTVYEVLHVEWDSDDFYEFTDQFYRFEARIEHSDWHDIAKQIWNTRDEWRGLKGFDQNHWKANFLLGWKQAEYTEKSI